MTASIRTKSIARPPRTVVANLEIHKTVKKPLRDAMALDLNPFSCHCSLVKAGTLAECPVHWLAHRMPESRH